MFSTSQPWPRVGLLFACVIGLATISFTAGVLIERGLWERSDMGVMCAKGHPWACDLNPKCSMRSLMCLSHPDRILENLQRKLDEDFK